MPASRAFGYEPSDLFYWEHRMGMWGACMLNEMDPAMPSLVGFGPRRLYAAAFGLPDTERFGKELQARLLERDDPELYRLWRQSSASPRAAPAPPPASPPPASPPGQQARGQQGPPLGWRGRAAASPQGALPGSSTGCCR